MLHQALYVAVLAKAHDRAMGLLEVCHVEIEKRVGGVRVLDLAAQHDDADLIRAMLHWGAEVNGVNEDGYTALHFAALMNAEQALTVLLEAGASTMARTSDGRSAFDMAMQYGPTYEKSALLVFPGDPQSFTITSLRAAIEKDWSAVVYKMALKMPITTKQAKYLLTKAVCGQHSDCVAALMEADPEGVFTAEAGAALQHAAKKGYIEDARTLLLYVQNDAMLQRALRSAGKSSTTEIMTLLMFNGARLDPNTVNQLPKLARQYHSLLATSAVQDSQGDLVRMHYSKHPLSLKMLAAVAVKDGEDYKAQSPEFNALPVACKKLVISVPQRVVEEDENESIQINTSRL